MCGIVGYSGKRPVLDVLIKGLSRLEYRGYDSTGVAFFNPDHLIQVIKNEGKLAKVQELIQKTIDSNIQNESHTGIGHTRWATHGKPTTQNAHPHRTGHIVLVHNGIIENYLEIKEELKTKGITPISETDSELYGYLVLEEMNHGATLLDAVKRSFRKLHGACSIVIMSEKEPGTVIGIRNGSPLVAAIDPQGGAFLASDAQPLLEYTKEIIFLENGDLALIQNNTLKMFDINNGQEITRKSQTLDWSAEQMDKGGYEHYMLKEIYDQPQALLDTLNGVLDRTHTDPFVLAQQPGLEILRSARELILIACGTSWHAALLGKYWIESVAKIPVQVELASEFRYRDPLIKAGTVIVGISQSGETADTLAVLREIKATNLKYLKLNPAFSPILTMGVTNVRGSTIAREADACFYISAGPEIGVAATKTFSSQLMMMLIWAGALAPTKKSEALAQTNPSAIESNKFEKQKLFDEVLKLPHGLKYYLEDPKLRLAIQKLASKYFDTQGYFFIGRGYSFPIALEAALKLKEIAYVHAEGYAAGELKHGPIAMLDSSMTVIVLAPQDRWREKTISNLEEVKARGARVIAIGGSTDAKLKALADDMIELPILSEESLLPFALTLAVQLFSYEIALLKGTDVDKPRNLAKSVTVE